VQVPPLGNVGLVGRRPELAAISAAAKAAADYRPSVVWIEGGAGWGKTALLRHALRDLPQDFTVVTAEADEFASELSFNVLEQLGVRQATAVFPAGLELLEYLGRLQSAGPVAVVVEDLHWADPESRAALLVAARRLSQDRVLVVVTSRPEPAPDDGWERFRFDPNRCLVVPMTPLSLAEVSEMARASGVNLPAAAAERVYRHTGGHPLYARTLLSEFSPAQLANSDGNLPVPRSLASATVARLAELPQGARSLAAALAVLNHGEPLQLVARVGGVVEPSRALDSLVSTGLVTWQPSSGQGLLDFTHPIYRAAVYSDLAPSRRQELHRAAAEAIGGRALAHRVAAADMADDALADELEVIAEDEAHGHHFGTAAAHLLSASQLTSAPEEAEARLLRAARMLLAAGQTGQVNALRPRLEECPPSPARSLVLGMVAWDHGEPVLAEKLLTEAAGLGSGKELGPGDVAETETAADALAQLSVIYVAQVRAREAVDAAAAALAYGPADPRTERTATMSAALGEAMLYGAPAGLDHLSGRLPADPERADPADVDLVITRGTLHRYAGHIASGVTDLRAALRSARHVATTLLPRAHLHLSQLLFDAGEWDEALVQGRVALSLLSDERRTWVEAQVHATLSRLLASRGQLEEAEAHLAAAQTAATELGTPEASGTTMMAEAALARVRNEPAKVVAALQVQANSEDYGWSKISSLVWTPPFIAALLDLGQVEAARAQLSRFRQAVAERRLNLAARIMALEAYLSAAEGRTERAVTEYRQAISLIGPDVPLLDNAFIHHGFGHLLQALGERREAVDQFRQAYKLFTSVGAVPFSRRAEEALASSGIGAPAAARRSPLDLTDREGDVVSLVAKGLSNREVAGQLYVSVNTVEYHLRNVFAKLGISSRRELRGVLVGQ
jgi:DNA-binding CsgD family transcriptional regulator